MTQPSKYELKEMHHRHLASPKDTSLATSLINAYLADKQYQATLDVLHRVSQYCVLDEGVILLAFTRYLKRPLQTAVRLGGYEVPSCVLSRCFGERLLYFYFTIPRCEVSVRSSQVS